MKSYLKGLLGLTAFWGLIGLILWHPIVVFGGAGILLILYVSITIVIWSGGLD
jgi:hypothetical protein